MFGQLKRWQLVFKQLKHQLKPKPYQIEVKTQNKVA